MSGAGKRDDWEDMHAAAMTDPRSVRTQSFSMCVFHTVMSAAVLATQRLSCPRATVFP